MKFFLFLFLLLVSIFSFGQSDEKEVIDFIASEELMLLRNNEFNAKKTKKQDFIIILYSDSLILKFRISDLAKVKLKDKRAYFQYKNALKNIREYYKLGTDSINISQSSSIERFILGGALSTEGPMEFVYKNKIYSSYKCEVFGYKYRYREILFVYRDKNNKLILAYSTLICVGPPQFK